MTTRTQIIDYLVPTLLELFDDDGPWQDADPIEWLEELALDIVQDTYRLLPDREAFFDVLKGELTSRGVLRQWPVSDEDIQEAVAEVMDWYDEEQGTLESLNTHEASEPFPPSLGRYTVLLAEETPEHWRAQVKEMPVCTVYGRTRENAMVLVRETLELFFKDAGTAILDEELTQ